MMKFDIFNKLTSHLASAPTRGYALVRQQVSDAAASTLDVSDSVRQKVNETIEHIDVDAAVGQVKEMTFSVGAQMQQLSHHVTDLVRKADRNHKEVAEGIETVSMGLGITAGVAAAGATLAAPSGLGAAAVALGLTSAPLIVTAAPVIAAAATTAGVVSGGAYFYSKWRSRNDVPADDPGMTSQRDAASGAGLEPHS